MRSLHGSELLRITRFGLAALAFALLVAALVLDRPAAGARAAQGACSPLDAAALRGRRIFRVGETTAGAVEGRLTGDAASLQGRDAACAGCHGPTGAGNEEGGVRVPSIQPERLLGARYDEASLAVALRRGQTPEGRRLRTPMPRFALDDAALADLGAYLRCLGHDRDPGVTDDAVRVGAALPLSGPGAELGAAVRDALAASFAESNERGGVFRRRIDLVVEDTGARGDAEAEARLIGGRVFALIASLVREDARRAERLEDAEIPLVLPFGAAPERVERGAFFLYPAEDMLARVAVAHLAWRGDAARLLVVHAQGEAGDRWVLRARSETRARGLPVPAALAVEGDRLDASRVIDAARGEGAQSILFVAAPTNLEAVVTALAQLPGVTLYAQAGALEGGASAPASLRDRVLLLDGGLPRAAFDAGSSELAATLRRHSVAARHLAFQAGAAVAARVLVEGLRRAGSPPTRDGLIAALESLRDFETGLAPSLSFGRNRHTGVLGAHVLRLDEAPGAQERASTWIGITP